MCVYYDHSPTTRTIHIEPIHILYIYIHIETCTKRNKRYELKLTIFLIRCLVIILNLRRFSVSLTYRQSCITHRKAAVTDSYIPDNNNKELNNSVSRFDVFFFFKFYVKFCNGTETIFSFSWLIHVVWWVRKKLSSKILKFWWMDNHKKN